MVVLDIPFHIGLNSLTPSSSAMPQTSLTNLFATAATLIGMDLQIAVGNHIEVDHCFVLIVGLLGSAHTLANAIDPRNS